mmetsp:Transcript_28441/g.71595  ORF Transcript_28441/g.71595 Transcript_28441/m.71595 type:complete len:245 (-) Transcript_28441:1054-1788(-)
MRPLGRTSSEPTLSCMLTISSTRGEVPSLAKGAMALVHALIAEGSSSCEGSVAEHHTVLYGEASIARTMQPVTDSSSCASPPDWSEPMVGSSSMRTELLGSSCLSSHAADATSVTNMRGGRSGIGARRLRMRNLLSSCFSTPSRSFCSICSMLEEVEAPRSPHSHEHVIRLLCTHAKGMPWLYRICATSRLTRRARQQKTTRWSGKSSAIVGAIEVLPVSGGERSSTSCGPGCSSWRKSESCVG